MANAVAAVKRHFSFLTDAYASACATFLADSRTDKWSAHSAEPIPELQAAYPYDRSSPDHPRHLIALGQTQVPFDFDDAAYRIAKILWNPAMDHARGGIAKHGNTAVPLMYLVIHQQLLGRQQQQPPRPVRDLHGALDAMYLNAIVGTAHDMFLGTPVLSVCFNELLTRQLPSKGKWNDGSFEGLAKVAYEFDPPALARAGVAPRVASSAATKRLLVAILHAVDDVRVLEAFQNCADDELPTEFFQRVVLAFGGTPIRKVDDRARLLRRLLMPDAAIKLEVTNRASHFHSIDARQTDDIKNAAKIALEYVAFDVQGKLREMYDSLTAKGLSDDPPAVLIGSNTPAVKVLAKASELHDYLTREDDKIRIQQLACFAHRVVLEARLRGLLMAPSAALAPAIAIDDVVATKGYDKDVLVRILALFAAARALDATTLCSDVAKAAGNATLRDCRRGAVSFDLTASGKRNRIALLAYFVASAFMSDAGAIEITKQVRAPIMVAADASFRDAKRIDRNGLEDLPPRAIPTTQFPAMPSPGRRAGALGVYLDRYGNGFGTQRSLIKDAFLLDMLSALDACGLTELVNDA